MTGHYNPIAELFERGDAPRAAADEKYARVEVRLLRKPTRDAILVARADSPDRQSWIPRSLIHGADETHLDSKQAGELLSLRIFEWKARQAGLVS
jgi:hypothetical protein